MALKSYPSCIPQFKKFSVIFVSSNQQKYPVNLSCTKVNMVKNNCGNLYIDSIIIFNSLLDMFIDQVFEVVVKINSG